MPIKHMYRNDICKTDFAILRSGNVEFDGLIHMLFKYDLGCILEENWDRLSIAFYRDGAKESVDRVVGLCKPLCKR